jgi:hypothetical protein
VWGAAKGRVFIPTTRGLAARRSFRSSVDESNTASYLRGETLPRRCGGRFWTVSLEGLPLGFVNAATGN